MCDVAAAAQNAAEAGRCNTSYPKSSGAASSARHSSRHIWDMAADVGPARIVIMRKGTETSADDMVCRPARSVEYVSRQNDAAYQTITGHTRTHGSSPSSAAHTAAHAAT